MEDLQNTSETSQNFENIDFNSSPEKITKENSNNDDHEQVQTDFYKNTNKNPYLISIGSKVL